MGCGGSSIVSSSGIVEIDGPNGKQEKIGRGISATVTGTSGTNNPDGQVLAKVFNDGGLFTTAYELTSTMTPATGSIFTLVHGPGGASLGTSAARLSLKTVVPANHATFVNTAMSPFTVTESVVGDQEALSSYFIFCNSNAGPIQVIIPTASAGTPLSSRTLCIKDVAGNAATNFITIQPVGGNIDGAAAVVINRNWGTITITERGTGNWGTIAVRGASTPAIISGTVDIPAGDKLEFNTTDFVIDADGTDAVVDPASTGVLVFSDQKALTFGSSKNTNFLFNVATNEMRIRGADVVSALPAANTSAIDVRSGGIENTGAVVGAGGSGQVSIVSGTSLCSNAGGTGHSSGAVSVLTGNAIATAGTAGNTGSITLETGATPAGISGDVIAVSGNVTGGANPSGNVVLTTGSSAGGARGMIVGDAQGFHPKGIYTNGTFPAANATVYTQGMITLVFDLPNRGVAGVQVYDFTLPPNRGFLVLDAWAIKTGAVGGPGDTVQVRNAAGNPISQDMSLNVASEVVVRTGTLVTGAASVAGSSILKVYHTDAGGGSNSACRVLVSGIAVV